MTVAMNCTFCDMPFESASILLVAPLGEVEPLEPDVISRSMSAAFGALERAVVPEQPADGHLR